MLGIESGSLFTYPRLMPVGGISDRRLLALEHSNCVGNIFIVDFTCETKAV